MPYFPPARSAQRFVDIEGPNTQETAPGDPDGNYYADNISGVYQGDLFSMAGDVIVEQFDANNLWFTEFDFSGCIRLQRVNIGNNSGESFTFAGCSALTRLFASAGGPVDLTGCASMERLSLFGPSDAPLDVSDCTALRYLNIGVKQITDLDLSANVNLEYLNAANAGTLENLTLPGTSALFSLNAYSQAIASIDLTGCSGIIDLDLSENPLTSIDITPCTAIKGLFLSYCPSLTSITTTGITTLETVDLSQDVLISSFPVTTQTNLKHLYLEGCNFSSLDVSGLALLQDIEVGSQVGGLSSLTLSGNSALQFIRARVNSLTSFPSLTGCPITYIDATNNALSQAAVDQILADLDANGLSNGYCLLDGGTNSTPSAAGLASSLSLQGKGWGVNVN